MSTRWKIVKGFPATSQDDYQLNLISFLKFAAKVYPEQEVVSRNLDGSLYRSNYAYTYRRVQQLANGLESIGLKAGDRVGVMEWNTHRFCELYFAVSGMGAVLLEVNPRISAEERTYVLQHSEASFLAVSETMLPLLEPSLPSLTGIKAVIILRDDSSKPLPSLPVSTYDYEALLEKQLPVYEWPMVDERSAAVACYTSGTTGKPKGVYQSHRALYLHTWAIAHAMRLTHDDVVLQLVPMFHAQGWGVFFAAPMVGAKLVFPGRYAVDNMKPVVDLILQEKVSATCGAPAVFMPMLECIRAMDPKPDLAGLRMISGATEPPLAMMKGYWDLGKAQVIHAYGATETAPLVTINHLKPSLKFLDDDAKWELKKKQGLPVMGLDVDILGPDGNLLPHDGKSVGEVIIRGPWITGSYYNDPRSQEAFTEDGYWRSGDAGTIDEYGYLKITDRFKDLIKSGGEWISSVDLENAIMAHPAVLEATVIGIPHPKWEERPLALVILRKDYEGKVTKEGILDFIRPKFAKWQLPDEVLFVNEIPKTSVGKFAKRVARDLYKDFYMKESKS